MNINPDFSLILNTTKDWNPISDKNGQHSSPNSPTTGILIYGLLLNEEWILQTGKHGVFSLGVLLPSNSK